VPNNGLAVPPKLEATCPSQSVGTASASSGTAVHDGAPPFCFFVSKLGTAMSAQARTCQGFRLLFVMFLT